MKILNVDYKIIPQEEGLDGMYKAAELPGRICYHSMDKLTKDSAKPFVERLMKVDHGAPLEHATIYIVTREELVYQKYLDNEYSRCVAYDTGEVEMPKWPAGFEIKVFEYAITTNLRVLHDNKWMDDLKYMVDEPNEHHERRIMVQFTCDLGVSREYNRHRADSINEESTRYCNYSKEKFGSELNIIEPEWIKYKHSYNVSIAEDPNSFLNYCKEIVDESYKTLFGDIDYWLFANLACEWSYMNLIRVGWKPQQARTVLPLDTKTSLIHTAFVSDWVHFFNLRALGTTGAPHPQAKELAEPLMNEFISMGLIKFNEEKLVLV